MDAGETAADQILLVDDSPANLRLLYSVLEGRGYRLLVARSGEEALSISARTRISLMLLDVMMPGIDGYEVCRRLKASPAQAGIAVIFLSALGQSEDKVRGLDLGAVDYIAKPFDTEEVIARVETHLKIRRLERKLSNRNRDLEQANQRMRADLLAAARVQRALLPQDFAGTEDCRFSWLYRPCEELGGDSLNIFQINSRYVGLYILDVCGHGVPSALWAVTVARSLMPTRDRSSLVTRRGQGDVDVPTPPAEVARRLNGLFPMDTESRLYFTLLYGVLDRQACEFHYVAAGHPGPVLQRPGVQPSVHDAPAVPIGLLPDSEYEDSVLRLRPGDRLYLHSDGVIEERDPNGELFGRDRLAESVRQGADVVLKDAIEAVVAEVVAWKGDPSLRDDVSMIGVEVGQRHAG